MHPEMKRRVLVHEENDVAVTGRERQRPGHDVAPIVTLTLPLPTATRA